MQLPDLILPAPAKLNLFLHITGRRSDGYHLLQTLFQLVDYGDELSFKSRADGRIYLEGDNAGVSVEDNLVYRAAKALQHACGSLCGVDINLNKRLPAGGGLGGGSSDAATTLIGLNHLWQTGLTCSQLADIGVTLGADVPVFVRGRSAMATGIGEHLEPVNLEQCYYLVIHPAENVATKTVFEDKNLTRNSSAITLAAFLRGAKKNDCEQVVRTHYPAVDKAMTWLSKYTMSHLTGTGACVFARFATIDQAQAVLDDVPLPWQGFVAKGINTSPVHELLGITHE